MQPIRTGFNQNHGTEPYCALRIASGTQSGHV
jgi:hypothetical protein